MKSNEKKLYLLGEEKVSKALLKLGIPSMIGMMTSALYNVVDSYFVGMLGTAQIGAVSVVYPISLIILGLGLLFGSGACAYIARLLGDKKYKEADECASTAVTASVITGIIIICFILIFINPILKLLGATNSILPYAKEYGIIFIIGLIFNIFNITVNNIITAEGASMFSMIAMLIGGLVNIVLDPICILLLSLGVKGAAIATLSSRIISTILYVYYIKSGKSNLHFEFKNCNFNKSLFVEIFKIGIPMLAYQFLLSFSISITNNQTAVYGDSAIASVGIVSRVISLGIMMVMGFMKGYQPFVGYNFGAGKFDRVKESTKLAIVWSTVFCVISSIVVIICSKNIILLFSKNDMEVLTIGTKVLILNAITFTTMGYQVAYSMKFMGMGKAKEGGLICIGRQGIFFVPILLVLSHVMGLNGIIITQPLADICSLILVYVLVKKDKHTLPNVQVSQSAR